MMAEHNADSTSDDLPPPYSLPQVMISPPPYSLPQVMISLHLMLKGNVATLVTCYWY